MKLLMKRVVFVGACLLLLAGPVLAAAMYVTDIVEITLRTGPSLQNKILTFLQSGQRLEIIQKDDQWSQVRTSGGTEGWVLNRYLTPQPTSKIRLERLEEKLASLSAQNAALAKENNEIKADNRKYSSDLNTTDKDLKQVREEYEALKAESGEFLALKTKFEKTSARLQEETKKAQQLEEQVSKLERSYAIKWFLAGAGVLLFGLIIGFSLKRQRRRPSLL